MAEVAVTELRHGVGDKVKVVAPGTEVKPEDFPEGVFEHFKENGAIAAPAQPTVAMEEENAALKKQIEALKAQLVKQKAEAPK